MLNATESDTKNLSLYLIRHIQKLKKETPEDIERLLLWYRKIVVCEIMEGGKQALQKRYYRIGEALSK